MTDIFTRFQIRYPIAVEQDQVWHEEFGAIGAQLIRRLVDENMQDYEYLKQFAVKPQPFRKS
jgi:hypothetical protein